MNNVLFDGNEVILGTVEIGVIAFAFLALYCFVLVN